MYLRMCRRYWEEFMRTLNRRDRIVRRPVVVRARREAVEAELADLDRQLGILEIEAAAILRALGDRPLRGVARG